MSYARMNGYDSEIYLWDDGTHLNLYVEQGRYACLRTDSRMAMHTYLRALQKEGVKVPLRALDRLIGEIESYGDDVAFVGFTN